jgi:rubredoxin
VDRESEDELLDQPRTERSRLVQGRKCPECGSTDIRLSRRSGLLITLAKVINMSRFKCRTCGHRFFGPN